MRQPKSLTKCPIFSHCIAFNRGVSGGNLDDSYTAKEILSIYQMKLAQDTVPCFRSEKEKRAFNLAMIFDSHAAPSSRDCTYTVEARRTRNAIEWECRHKCDE